jgi:hypothetical protein
MYTQSKQAIMRVTLRIKCTCIRNTFDIRIAHVKSTKMQRRRLLGTNGPYISYLYSVLHHVHKKEIIMACFIAHEIVSALAPYFALKFYAVISFH